MAKKTRKAKTMVGITDAPWSAADLVSLHEAHIGYFDELRKSGAENELYLRARNFSESQEKQIYSQERTPFPMPILAHKAWQFIASERNNRTSFKCDVKNKDGEVKAVLATMRLKDVERNSNGEYVESDVIESGIGTKFGAVKIKTKLDKNLQTVVYYEEVDYQNMFWDTNAKTYNKEDATFMGEIKQVYRRDIRLDYGDEIADNIELSYTREGRKIRNYWGIQSQTGDRDMDIISLFEQYQKAIRDYYYVMFGDNTGSEPECVFKTTSKQEADETLNSLKQPYLALNQPIPKAYIEMIPEIAYDKYVFTYNTILEYEKTDFEFYPYSIYQSFWFKDQIWCLTDMLKSPAKFIDKLISQIDYAFGADIKNGWEIVEPWLAEGCTLQQAIYNVTHGIPVPVNHSGAIKSIAMKGANPQWMEMLNVLSTVIDASSGGVWSGGQKDGHSREAQGTVQLKMMQGQMIPAMFIDNKRRWKLDLGNKLIWFLKKYDTAQHIIKVHGSDLRPEMIQILQQHNLYEASSIKKHDGYLTVNQEGNELSYLDNAEFEILVSQSELTETQRQMKQAELRAFKEAGYVIPAEVWMEFSDMDYDIKQMIIEANAQAGKEAAQDKEDAKGLELLKVTKGEGEGANAIENTMANKQIKKQKQLQEQN
jgi:hypothetical protein